MNSWLSPKILIAVAIAIVGALVAGQLPGTVERVMVVGVSMLIALFVAADPHDSDSSSGESRKDPNSIDPQSITSHPQLQSFIDAS
ncbi:MAG TPA: hypothetical protein VGN36_07300, partial [Sphingorhabdus sp.]|nr:hypothetical protein [Sphingorhabdus sp.]